MGAQKIVKMTGIVSSVCGVRMDAKKPPDGGLAEGVEVAFVEPHVVCLEELGSCRFPEFGYRLAGGDADADDDFLCFSWVVLVGGILDIFVETNTIDGEGVGRGDDG